MLHEGRIRGHPHIAGQWATHTFIECNSQNFEADTKSDHRLNYIRFYIPLCRKLFFGDQE